jgi:hypothetical protein
MIKLEKIKRNIFIHLIVMSITIQMHAQITYPIVDTDVSEFYSDAAIIAEPNEGEAFYGQDANYSGNQPSYTDNGNGTVTDNVTGLIWQQDMGVKMSFADAEKYVDTMTLGGFTDWRIPTIKELYSLAYFSGRCMGNDVVIKFIDTNYFAQPIGDESSGERQIDAQTWSKTHYVGLTMNGDTTIFGYNFVDGRLKGYPKYNPKDATPMKMYFRMVRGNVQYGINNFTENGDGTITDQATGLMWQQADNGNTYDWESALSYAENLSLAGHNDWRLPNAKELHSIVDYTRSPSTSSSPTIDPLFSCTSINDYDGNPGQYGYYWTSSPLKDGPTPYTDAVYIAFGEAQGKMESPPLSGTYVLMDVHGAGAQRNDPKSGSASDFPDSFGPQGDIRYVYNFVRCVRDVQGTSSVKQTENESHIKVYPNPARSKVTIAFNENYKEIELEILNLLGSPVQNYFLKNVNQFTLDVSSFTPGIYTLLINMDDERGTKILVVE